MSWEAFLIHCPHLVEAAQVLALRVAYENPRELLREEGVAEQAAAIVDEMRGAGIPVEQAEDFIRAGVHDGIARIGNAALAFADAVGQDLSGTDLSACGRVLQSEMLLPLRIFPEPAEPTMDVVQHQCATRVFETARTHLSAPSSRSALEGAHRIVEPFYQLSLPPGWGPHHSPLADCAGAYATHGPHELVVWTTGVDIDKLRAEGMTEAHVVQHLSQAHRAAMESDAAGAMTGSSCDANIQGHPAVLFVGTNAHGAVFSFTTCGPAVGSTRVFCRFALHSYQPQRPVSEMFALGRLVFANLWFGDFRESERDLDG